MKWQEASYTPPFVTLGYNCSPSLPLAPSLSLSASLSHSLFPSLSADLQTCSNCHTGFHIRTAPCRSRLSELLFFSVSFSSKCSFLSVCGACDWLVTLKKDSLVSSSPTCSGYGSRSSTGECRDTTWMSHQLSCHCPTVSSCFVTGRRKYVIQAF